MTRHRHALEGHTSEGQPGLLVNLWSGQHGQQWSVFRLMYYVLFALALVLIGLFVWDNRSSLKAIWQVPPYLWIIPTLIYLGMVAVKGLSFDVLAQVHGTRVPLLDSIGLTASGLLSNYAVPGNISIPLRTLYLHRVLGLHYKHFLSIVIAAFIFSTGLYGVFAGIAGLAYGQIPSPAYGLVMLLFSGGGVILMLAISLPYQWLPLFGHRIEGVLLGWRLLLRSRTLFGKWLAIELIRAILEIAFFYSIVQILKIEITLAQTAVLVLAKECSVFLRVTPGAFGIAEGVLVFFAIQFGVNVAAILAAALISRAIELVCLSVMSSALVPRLGRRLAGAAPGPRDSRAGSPRPRTSDTP